LNSKRPQPRPREIGAPRGVALIGGVLLHGRGRSLEEKVDLAARFDGPGRVAHGAHESHRSDAFDGAQGIRWIVPRADTGSWYPNRFFDGVAANEPHLSLALERCHLAVEEASEGGRLKPAQLVIAGFSQGACLALEYALRHPGRVGTLIVLTGALIGTPEPGIRLDGLRVLLTGSDVDDWVPEQYVHQTARVFTELGAVVTLRMYPGRPHIVNEDEIVEARELLTARLKEAAV
jgi:phospholipase/carboxylesterase